MNYYGFKPYVSVAKRQANALREMKKLKKKGIDIRPIEIEKRKITQSFWGNAWCNHIESFSDYENRLPRGRTYIRNGSVCHLLISKGSVEAFVSGSELYKVQISINSLPNKQWKTLKTRCSGKISSLLDLLNGQLSEGVMQVVSHRNEGLFPLSKDIKLSCNCPDWATMCKHVAAVLYGVGARLDHSPEKLFELRGVDHNELIDASTIAIETTQDSGSRRRRIDQAAIADVFDIDLSNKTSHSPTKKSKNTSRKSKTAKSPQPPSQLPSYFSGTNIRKKRQQLKLTQAAFAKHIGVSATTISHWESKGRCKLNVRESVKEALESLW